MQRCTCHFSGRVQGVGFRYTARQAAAAFKVTGYVRNLPDGRVEMVVEGDPDEIEALMSAIGEKMEPYIHNVQRHTAPASGEFGDFSVRH